jgi:cob(I)alamin adenosyltransferase
MPVIQKGLIHIYTGDGKGKTTTAVGLACRARGHDLKVCYVYFCKDPGKCLKGEHRILKKIGVNLYGFAKKYPGFCKNIAPAEVREECLRGLRFILRLYRQNKYDVLVLDEVLVALRDGFLKEEEVINILETKPENLELVLTGRGATKKIMGKTDLVSEIKKIKHPYDSGVGSRKGIEY